jgi:hypothetical protein
MFHVAALRCPHCRRSHRVGTADADTVMPCQACGAAIHVPPALFYPELTSLLHAAAYGLLLDLKALFPHADGDLFHQALPVLRALLDAAEARGREAALSDCRRESSP